MARPSAIRSVKSSKAFVHMVVVADSGWGKTVFAGTAPNALFLVCDPEGTISAKAMGSTADQWDIKSYEDLDEAYCWLRDEGHEEYDWVIVDTAGGMQRILQRSALDKAYAEKPATRDPDVPAMDTHQKVQLQVIKFTMKMHDLPMNVMWTAHPYNLEDADGDPMMLPYVHGGKGEVAQQFLGHMNIAGYGVTRYADNDENKVSSRRLYFCHSGPKRGKDRFIKLGRYKDNLTVPKMMEVLNTPRRPAKKTAARKAAASAK